MNTYSRFLSKIRNEGSCWIWTGAKDSKGRARFLVNGKNMLAKVFCYEYHSKTKAQNVTQSCGRPDCVRYEHLLSTRSGAPSKFSREKILCLKKEGLTIKEIAAQLGCSESLVRKLT